MTDQISLNLIDPNPFQPRMAEDAAVIGQLADSIERNGLLQIPSARKVDGRYQLAFGHTRKAAFVMLAERDRSKFGAMPLNIVELTDLQMFEAAVSENIQRRDLNPVEVAQAMKRYMQDFGKTSDECGAFFGVNGATVRGKVRLLDLPDAAQKALAGGKISEGAARALLTFSKLADENSIKRVLKDIQENRNGTPPEEIISDALEQLDNVEQMWPSHWDGKPRGGRNLWLLDMKNFPNKTLPLFTGHTVVQALDCFNDKPAQKLMLEWAEYLAADQAPDSGDADIDRDYHAANKEQMRKRIEKLGEINQIYVQRLEHLLNPPACTACPFYTVIDRNHYCGLKICWERKAKAFKAQKFADAIRTLKIPLHQDSDGPYFALDHNIPAHKKAFDARHADLRLVPDDVFKGGYVWQRFDGLDAVDAKVVVVGASFEKLAVRGSKSVGKKTEKEKAEMRAMRLFRQVRRELVWEYTAAAKTIFEGVPIEVLKKIRSWHFVGIDDRIPDEYNHPNTGTDDQQMEFAQRDLVWALVIGKTSHYDRHELTDYLTAFAKFTGVKAPKALVKKAETWDAEIADLAKPAVAVETNWKAM